MKLVLLYRPKSEHSTLVESFGERVESAMSNVEIEKVDVDSPEGTTLLETYGIFQFPTVMVMANNGSLLDIWKGDLLPPVDVVVASLRR